MTDLDHLLARMGALPPDPRLPAIEDTVLAGVDAARTPALPGMALGVVGACALMLGVAAGALPAPRHPSANAPANDPLAVQALAPSTLLAEAR